MKQDTTRIKLNWPIAAIVITFAILILGGWLALVITKTISIETGIDLASHFAAFLGGAFTPMILYWKDKKLKFDVDSDPPSGRKSDVNA